MNAPHLLTGGQVLDLMILSSLHAHSTLPALTHRGPDMMGGGGEIKERKV